MYCFTCGAKIDDDALVCPKCGNRTDHYHHEKTTQQSAPNTSNVVAAPQHYAQATPQQYAQSTPQESAWATPPQYAQSTTQESAWATPQHYAQSTSQQYVPTSPSGMSTLQGPSVQSSAQLNVGDLNAYKQRMAVRKQGKSKRVALVLCIFLGFFGIHRFYLGKIGTGIIWFLTVGVILVGWVVDIALIANNSLCDKEGRKLI